MQILEFSQYSDRIPLVLVKVSVVLLLALCRALAMLFVFFLIQMNERQAKAGK